MHGVVAAAGTSTLAVLDTGVDANAPDLAGRVIGGWSFDGSDPATDPNGHGTHEATIAAGSADDGGIAGVAYAGVNVMPVRVLGADGTGQDADIISGLVYAVDHGANVVLMAFSNPGESAALQAAIDYAWSNGVVVVAAAGNDSGTTATYPAGLSKVVGVGATQQGDAVWAGSNQSDAVFIDVPGVGIDASDVSGVTSVTGTSASAAIVAGRPALLRANDPSASAATVIGRLARNADPTTGGESGNGRINLARAIADTSTAGVTPAGVPGGGGPVVGPYVAEATCTSQGSGGNWSSTATWSCGRVPLTTDTAVIASGSPVTVTTSNGSAPTALTVNVGATLTINSGITLTINGNVAVTGTVTNAGTLTNASGSTTFNSGALYNHNQNGGTIPTATWNANSTMAVTGWTNSTANPPTGIGQAFGNFIWNSPSQTSSVSWAGALASVAGNFTVTSTGSGDIRLGNTGAGDLTVGGNFSQTGGTFYVSSTQGAARTVTVGGNFSLTGGTFDLSDSSTAANGSVVNVAGNFTHSAGTLDETGSTTGSGIIFNGSGAQTYTSGGTVTGNVNFTVNSGATLDLASSLLGNGSSGSFTLSSGATLGIGDSAGITSSGTTGNVRVSGTRTFSTGANYIYEGGAQSTGSGLPGTVNNLTINNAGIKTATSAVIVSGALTVGSGATFATGAFSDQFKGNVVNNGTFTATSGSTVALNGSAAQTITGTTPSFQALTINNSAGVSFAGSTGDMTVAGTFTLTSGVVTTGSNTLVANGGYSRAAGYINGKLQRAPSLPERRR